MEEFNRSLYIATVSDVAGVSANDVQVQYCWYQVSTSYTFNSRITEDQAKAVIADAAAVEAGHVQVTMAPNRRLAISRRLAIPVAVTINISQASAVAGIAYRASNKSHLQRALQRQRVAVDVEVATQPRQFVRVSTLMKCHHGNTKVMALASNKLATALEQSFGVPVIVSVSHLPAVSVTSAAPFAPSTASPPVAVTTVALATPISSSSENTFGSYPRIRAVVSKALNRRPAAITLLLLGTVLDCFS